jgi:hypothetical protein
MSYLLREFDGTYAILQVSGFSFGEELWLVSFIVLNLVFLCFS